MRAEGRDRGVECPVPVSPVHAPSASYDACSDVPLCIWLRCWHRFRWAWRAPLLGRAERRVHPRSGTIATAPSTGKRCRRMPSLDKAADAAAGYRNWVAGTGRGARRAIQAQGAGSGRGRRKGKQVENLGSHSPTLDLCTGGAGIGLPSSAAALASDDGGGRSGFPQRAVELRRPRTWGREQERLESSSRGISSALGPSRTNHCRALDGA